MSGKTRFMVKLVQCRKALFTTEFARILYSIPSTHSDSHQAVYEELKQYFPNVELIYDLPLPGEILDNDLPKLLLIDDQMNSIFADKFMEEMFIQNSHHNSISIIFTSQNFFSSSKSKTIIRQCTYKVFFDNPSDRVLLRTISCQITPENPNFLLQIFKHLEEWDPDNTFNYVLIDANPQSCMRKLNVRSNIFPEKDGEIRPLCFFTGTDNK